MPRKRHDKTQRMVDDRTLTTRILDDDGTFNRGHEVIGAEMVPPPAKEPPPPPPRPSGDED
jgi:hypothetical protein